MAVKLAAALVSVPAVRLVVVPLFAFWDELVPELPLVFDVVAEDVGDEVVSEPAVVLVDVPLPQPASTKQNKLNTQIVVVRRTVDPPLCVIAFVAGLLLRGAIKRRLIALADVFRLTA